jgi:formylglycine-generating enzyme required for sulfatase activity
MPIVFVSRNSQDDAAVTALENWLHSNGFTGTFVDHHGIAGGDKWREELRASAGACRVIICLVTESWLASLVLSADAERVLKPGDTFRECAEDCPEMIVVPAGEFLMGSLITEKDRYDNEDDGIGQQHKVTIAKPFVVSKFDVTFADWDACVSVGGCPKEGGRNDAGWGRGKQPVIYVNWDDAKVYVTWLSMMTGNNYRLLTEAEWEYATRAGTTTAYF